MKIQEIQKEIGEPSARKVIEWLRGETIIRLNKRIHYLTKVVAARITKDIIEGDGL